MLETLGVATMSEISDNEKDNDVTPDTNSEEPKKVPDLNDTISRLLRRKADADAGESGDAAE
ncbi:MAG: hypothetical protein COB20_00620 [SAR86 cluster bacterium]|uniref:Uncharacterized protein n=1 Tax=SAR86 cluster bacterium TaxID=2030880 RepID=A0A2A4XI39_9GAMM|nr:MAG: hypothetical protein COB20_00620 [SAR86 cluster bacterium]